MTPRNETRNESRSDNRLLLAVAAVVVLGAIGIAVVAGLATRDDTSEVAGADRAGSPARVSSPPAVREATNRATPASFPVPDRNPVVGAEAAGSVPEAATTPVFEIDPATDVWREGNRAYQARRYAEAAAYFAADTAARPQRAYTHYMHGLSLWKSGRLDSAITAMERAADLNDGSIRTHVNLSRIQNERGEHESALDAAERALGLDTENVTALYQKARSLYNLQRIDEAVVCLEACIALDAAAGHAHNLLGLIYLQRGEDIAAQSAFEVAAALEPDAAFVRNNLGLALERNGRLGEAAIAFRRAVELDPHHEPAVVSRNRVEQRLAGTPAELGADLTQLAAAAVPTTQATEPEPEPSEHADAADAAAGSEEGD